MSSDPTFDPEFFQQLLASAFTVQECGMKTQSLATIVELQKSIRTGEMDADTTMHLIAERAQEVANASGVAIGRLRGDQLVYAAGSGTAAPYIGRRVMAIFSTSRNIESKGEFLRVENSADDDRIEAAVCRQFGVNSLLMLPIFCGRSVAGVLQVLFSDAHVFEDQEVRTYRILAGLVGDAMSLALAAQSSHVAPLAMAVGFQPGTRMLAAPARPPETRLIPQKTPPVTVISSVPLLSYAKPVEKVRLPDLRLATVALWQRAKHIPAYKRSRISGLVAASVVGTFTWMLCAGRPAISSSLPPSHSTSPVVTQPSAVPAQAQPVDSSIPKTVNPVPRRALPRILSASAPEIENGIKHFGSDVTVRYFAPPPVAVHAKSNSHVRQISDDVTVRYFGSGEGGLEPSLQKNHQSSLSR